MLYAAPLWTLLASPADSATIALNPAPRGGISFAVDSSAGEVRGRADVFTAMIDPEAGTGSVVIAASGLTTGFGPRDQRMLVYALDVPTFPEVRFDLERIEGSLAELRARSGDGALRLAGRLTVRDITAPVALTATFAWEGEALRLRGDHELRWADFGVPDPSVVIARVADTVRVHFDLLGKPE
jgi:polyisoprenoid-binding protein YceI